MSQELFGLLCNTVQYVCDSHAVDIDIIAQRILGFTSIDWC